MPLSSLSVREECRMAKKREMAEKVAKKLEGYKRYRITYAVSGAVDVEVEARSEEEADEIGWESEKNWDEMEISDMQVIEIDEVE